MRLHGLPALLLIRNLACMQLVLGALWIAALVATALEWNPDHPHRIAWGGWLVLGALGSYYAATWGWALADETLMRHDITRQAWFDRPLPAVWLAALAVACCLFLGASGYAQSSKQAAMIGTALTPPLLMQCIAMISCIGIVNQCRYNIRRRRFFIGNWQSALAMVSKSADATALTRIQAFVASQTGVLDSVSSLSRSLVQAGHPTCRAPDLAAAHAAIPLKAYVLPGLRNSPTHPVSDHPWIADFMGHFQQLRVEIMQAVAGPQALTPYPLLGMDAWKSIALYKGGVRLQDGCNLCPQLARLVEQLVPGGPVREVMVSVLEPSGHLPPHIDNTLPMLTLHVPLVAPAPSGIRIGNELHPWIEGQPLIIDTTFEHEAWNHSQKRRVNLMIDFWPNGLTSVEKRFFSEVYRLQMKQHLPQPAPAGAAAESSAVCELARPHRHPGEGG